MFVHACVGFVFVWCVPARCVFVCVCVCLCVFVCVCVCVCLLCVCVCLCLCVCVSFVTIWVRHCNWVGLCCAVQAGEKTRSINTIASTFKRQLSALEQTLLATTPHYVRCIKPNKVKGANRFDAPMILDQLLYRYVNPALSVPFFACHKHL